MGASASVGLLSGLAPPWRAVISIARISFAKSLPRFASILPFFPVLLRERGLSTVQVGGVLAAMSLVGLFSAPMGGHLSDTGAGPAAMLRTAVAVTSGAAIAPPTTIVTTGSARKTSRS